MCGARILLVDDDPLLLGELQALLARHGRAAVLEEAPMPHPHLKALLEDLERRHILAILRLTHWNKSEAARRVGLRRTTLLHRLRALGIPLQPTSERLP